jgi:hypothetical protein
MSSPFSCGVAGLISQCEQLGPSNSFTCPITSSPRFFQGIIFLLSVMKKKLIDFSSGLVDTFTL